MRLWPAPAAGRRDGSGTWEAATLSSEHPACRQALHVLVAEFGFVSLLQRTRVKPFSLLCVRTGPHSSIAKRSAATQSGGNGHVRNNPQGSHRAKHHSPPAPSASPPDRKVHPFLALHTPAHQPPPCRSRHQPRLKRRAQPPARPLPLPPGAPLPPPAAHPPRPPLVRSPPGQSHRGAAAAAQSPTWRPPTGPPRRAAGPSPPPVPHGRSPPTLLRPRHSQRGPP